jgi:hypothetical protein
VQVRRDLPGREALGRQRQHDPVDPVQAPLPLAHDLRLEAAVAVAGHLDLHRADLGQHRLGPAPVAGVATISARRVVLAVAEVSVQLTFQRCLQHQLRQLRQQAALAGHAQPLGTGPGHQPGHELLIYHRARRRRYGRLELHLDRHRCLLASKELH